VPAKSSKTIVGSVEVVLANDRKQQYTVIVRERSLTITDHATGVVDTHLLPEPVELAPGFLRGLHKQFNVHFDAGVESAVEGDNAPDNVCVVASNV
jgi:hypothetical protein